MSSRMPDLAREGGGEYRSIFLSPAWQHGRYLGWRCEAEGPGLRILTRRQGLMVRRLFLCEADGLDALAASLPRRTGLLEQIIVHDFSGQARSLLTDRGYHELGADERLLNTATFVIDLHRGAEALRSALSADARRKLRRAEEAGLTFVDATGEDDVLDAFISAHRDMAGARMLRPISRDLTARMLRDGAARLFAVRDGDDAVAFLLAYVADDTGFFLHGAATAKDAGVGYLLQWGTIGALKAMGLRWYDMGGVPASDSSNGIYRFKRSFGGTFISLGTQYGRTGSGLRLARRLTQRVR